MRILLAIIFYASGGCFSSAPDVRPARDRWAVSAEGHSATRATWTGTLESAAMYDSSGNQFSVVVLQNPAGLNPNDVLSRDGTVVRSQPMPGRFYLRSDRGLLTDSPHLGQRVRVSGTLFTSHRGSVVFDGGRGVTVYPTLPATRPAGDSASPAIQHWSTALGWLRQQVWPIVTVERIEPADR